MEKSIREEIDRLYLEKCQEVNKLQAKLAEYRRLEKQGALKRVPCRIGQRAYFIRIYEGHKIIREGEISELFFREDMTLIAVVRCVGRGIVGETVFLSREAAEKAREAMGGANE